MAKIDGVYGKAIIGGKEKPSFVSSDAKNSEIAAEAEKNDVGNDKIINGEKKSRGRIVELIGICRKSCFKNKVYHLVVAGYLRLESSKPYRR